MPWGKGSIDRKMATGLRCRDRQTGLGSRATHTQIFYNLGMDRVHYVPDTRTLHFVNSEHFQLLETIERVYRGLNEEMQIEQQYLDAHGYYKGALSLKMSLRAAKAVLAALRLKGAQISIAHD